MLPFIEIKSDQVLLAPDQVVLRSADYQAYLTANQLVELARERAQAIEQGARDVYEQQKALGWQAGVDEARTSQATLIQETLQQCNQYYRAVEQKMSDVVLHAVRKILKQYDNTELALSVTREALSLVSNQKQVILHVQPEQVSAVRERVSHILKDFPEVGYVDVVADARLDEGGCILETEIGIIDASVDGQLAALATALTQSRER
ncbi:MULTISPECIES: HrpE/YscL family type III secretion apparatus protein [Pseudomonas]|jgi:type III secretion protein L|uniref:Type 3 secretion system stator protein n=1 Tax=Pseudomonas lundensis TaxID=86185 RepID=A0ABX4GQA9_9PSED|nr:MULTISPECIES: HrpE/YscL family type III secretion apparatus protein [Pseudomonas]AOZ12706.1 type III secretion system protein [Pseudomonas lundensis]MBS5837832.1 HrpE/YscL family type III secretion apparatus protein [Pseudomonas sp.]MCT8952520.1 HrpE/YscL family type III secretion apparatus protein [Pseudomonas lundensis]NLU02766.1 HrpE/YscL family type III secretion apparatus protein [Pseudomonas lundensis]NMZ53772.1 HrpE/YscL family type III secretion apparatus protein [Pseudomonas lunden